MNIDELLVLKCKKTKTPGIPQHVYYVLTGVYTTEAEIEVVVFNSDFS